MASSSHSHQNLKNNEKVEEKASKDGQEEEQRDWLELGLGLGICISRKDVANHGSNPVSDSHSSSLKIPSNHHQMEIGLGLGLGLEKNTALGLNDNDNDGGLRDVVGMEPLPPPCDYERHSSFGWSELDHYRNNNIHHDIVMWPSYQMGSQEWHMPIPYDSHHYCTRIRSPHDSGLWFKLLSSTNRTGEALPQISKAYIRVKDENMTIFMVKKYLVTKLGLSDETEIDISCMGQSLSQMQTLKQVRDTVWLPRLVQSVNAHDMSTNSLMLLLYRKQCIFS